NHTVASGVAGTPLTYTFPAAYTDSSTGKEYELSKTYIEWVERPGERRYELNQGDAGLAARNTTIAIGGTNIIAEYTEIPQSPDLLAVDIRADSGIKVGDPTSF